MKSLPIAEFKKLRAIHFALDQEFDNWRPHYQELAQYLLPRRYVWLSERSALKASTHRVAGADGNRAAKARNRKIIDSTGTKALRDLAAGMMNGITSPARPWLRLNEAGFENYQSQEHKTWYEEVARRMLLVMAQSNFYNALAIVYLEHAGFGTAACLIYEDFENVIHCYNAPLGEYRFGISSRGDVNRFTRTFFLTIEQAAKEFGEENLTEHSRQLFKAGGEKAQQYIPICHLIEPNFQEDARKLPSRFSYREFYWEHGREDPQTKTVPMLRVSGYKEKPGMWARWEVTGLDVYGTSPGMDALGDIIQLQHENLRKAQAIDKMTDPPVVIEGAMPSTKVSLLPGGTNYASQNASFGAKAIYTVSPPIGEMTQDMNTLRLRIRETFHNDLFRMISSLDTVRSATEIDARREEKLVLLGGVLERFEKEALDPAVRRIYNIMLRKELLPEPPPDLDPENVEIKYVSILSDAQRAIGTASIERFTEFYGNLLAAEPDLKATVNMDEILRDYADRLNITPTGLYSREQAQQAKAQNAELAQTREAALVGKDLTDAAKNLSDTEVGGGRNAIDVLLGN